MPGIFGIWTNRIEKIDIDKLLDEQGKCLSHYGDYNCTYFSISGKTGIGKAGYGKSSVSEPGNLLCGDKYILFLQGKIYNIRDLLGDCNGQPSLDQVKPSLDRGKPPLDTGLMPLSSGQHSPVLHPKVGVSSNIAINSYITDHFNYYMGGASAPSASYAVKSRIYEQSTEAILSLYLKSGWSWLPHADGRFCIALYNRDEHSIEIVSDRFGYSPLYYYKKNDLFIFGCEIKAVIKSAEVSREIDNNAVKEFFTFGYMLEDRTWFREVKVFPAGSIMKISAGKCEVKKYWSWDNIKPLNPPPTYREAIEETHRLWKDAVKSRLADNPTFAVALSGGLDSRAILAAIPDELHPVDLITYGDEDCDDVRFSRMSATVKNDKLHFREIYSEDWLEKRIEFVKWTDGLLSILHMHPASILDFYHEKFDVVLNGFVGDAFLGAIFLGKKGEDPFDSVFRQIYRKRPLGMNEVEAKEYLKPIFDKHRLRDELFIIHQRSRRFILMGLNWLSMSVEIHAPFTYFPLVDYVLSLPPEWRRNSRFYIDFLLKKYPEYFKKIPWQKTGFPAGHPHIFVRARKKINSFKKRFGSMLFPKRSVTKKNSFCDYSRWFDNEKTKKKAEEILLSGESLWGEIFDKPAVMKLVEGFSEPGKSDSTIESMGRLLTYEIFLESLNPDSA